MSNQLPDELAATVASWRSRARSLARLALQCDNNDELDQAQYLATMATMYYAVALDASHFGDLPTVPDDLNSAPAGNERKGAPK
jgi:hypothetical protein